METFELDELPEPEHDLLDIFCDAATWPNYVSDSMRIELVSSGPLCLQNKDGPFPKTSTIEVCLQIGSIKSWKTGRNSCANGRSTHLPWTRFIAYVAAYLAEAPVPLVRERVLKNGKS